jgi:hypothetical protein
MESNEAEDNEEREGDFYSHAHTLVLSAGSAHCRMESFGKQTSSKLENGMPQDV